MASSAGFDLATVQAALLSRLGWRNPTLAGYDIVDNGNQTSTSGRYFNDAHASCTIQNIKETQEDASISDADFNTLLQDWQKSNIAEVLAGVLSAPTQIESALLFHNCTDNFVPQPRTFTSDQFCGIRIRIGSGAYSVSIDSAQLLFDGNATFNLYLFQENKAVVLATIPVTVVANELKIVNVAQVLNNMSATNKGGVYYFGYFTADTDGANPLEYAQEWYTYKVFNAVTCTAPATGATTFSRHELNTSDANYGLNVELSSYHDSTAAIVRQAHQFDYIQGLLMAAKVIEQCLNCNRSNVVQRIQNNANMWFNELNAVPQEGMPYIPSIRHKIAKEMKRLQKIFCQVQTNTNVTYGTFCQN